MKIGTSPDGSEIKMRPKKHDTNNFVQIIGGTLAWQWILADLVRRLAE